MLNGFLLQSDSADTKAQWWTCANGFVEQHHLCHISCQIVWCAMRSIGRHWPATDGFNGGTIKLLLCTLLHCLCLFCIDYTGREPQDIMRFHFWASVFSTEKLARTVGWTSLGCRGLLQHLNNEINGIWQDDDWMMCFCLYASFWMKMDANGFRANCRKQQKPFRQCKGFWLNSKMSCTVMKRLFKIWTHGVCRRNINNSVKQ